jgi:phage terminase large subunit
MATYPTTLSRAKAERVRYFPRGAARDVFFCRAPEVLLSGPAGTGKSRGALERLHRTLLKTANVRALIVRKTRASLTQSGIVTYEQRVLHPMDGVDWRTQEQEYRYRNGSVLVVGGMDKATKVMSSEYDIIYVMEATELSEHDWESLTTRLRNGVLPYQQIMGDCNPDSPIHWLYARTQSNQTAMLESRHEDNPILWDAARGEWTPRGAEYIATLDRLSGVRLLRLRKGVWAAAEGMIHDGWDRNIHVIDRFDIPDSWPREWVVDFGYTNPFVWQAWAEDPDGRLYCYREIYMTQRLVEDHAKVIKRVTAGEPRPRNIICDHDAEDRATLERHIGMKTKGAHKTVSDGLQAVSSRLKVAGDGLPRLFYLRDSLVERDPTLTDRHLPVCTDQEYESYVWDTNNSRKKGEQPVKENDHGMDATRYVVAEHDLKPSRKVHSW